MKKILLSTVVMLVIAASIFGGYYYFSNNDLQETTVQENSQPQNELENEEELKASYPEKAEEWRMDAWRDANGDVASDGLANAVAQRDAYLLAHNNPDGLGDNGVAKMYWLPVGPQNIGGRTRSIIVDSSDTNIIWAGAASGGVWKSTDGGNFWTAMNGGLQNFAINCMAIDYPTGVAAGDGVATLWAGTGEGLSTVGLSGGGLFKSVNGGLSWTRINSTRDQKWQFIDSLAITHYNGNTIMLAGVEAPWFEDQITNPNRGIMRSTDGGTNWSPVAVPSPPYIGFTSKSIVVDPDNPGNVIANLIVENPSTHAQKNWIIYSSDAGATWTRAKRYVGLPNPPNFETPTGDQIVKLVFSQSEGEPVIYAEEASEIFPYLSKLSKSTDGGHTFNSYGLSNGIIDFSKYKSPLWVSPIPSDNNLIITGGTNLVRSFDGGLSFNPVPYNYSIGAIQPHLDAQYAIQDPNYGLGTNRRFYVTTDGGIYRTEDITASPYVTWVDRNNFFQTTQFYSAVGSAIDGSEIICGGTQDTGILRLIPGNRNAVRVVDGDAACSAVDDVYSYWTGQNNGELRRSPNVPIQPTGTPEVITNGISDYSFSPSAVPWIAPMALDPSDPNRLYFGGSSVWRSNNIHEQNADDVLWTEIRKNPTVTPSPSGTQSPVPYKPVEITDIEINPVIPQVMWVAESSTRSPVSYGKLYKTYDATATNVSWFPIEDNTNDHNFLPDRKILKVLVDRTSPSILYVGLAGRDERNLWRTTTGGSPSSGNPWTDITGGFTTPNCNSLLPSPGLPCVPVNTIAQDPFDANKIYVGTDIGVYVTNDVTATPVVWQPVTNGPANVKISDLSFIKGTNKLLAATYGRGLWVADLYPALTTNNAINDFDGDGRSDIAVVREDSAHKMWHLQGSTESYRSQEFGNRDDQAAPADYDGDGKTDIAVYRGTEQKFYCLRSSDNTLATTQLNHQASQAEAALAADFDGDDLADKAVFDPYTGDWKVEQSNNGHLDFHWGEVGDTAVALDFNTDGQADFGVYHEANGMITLSYTANGEEFQKQFGLEGDVPVPGEYDGDKAMDLAVWRPDDDGEGNGCWYISYGANNYEGYDAIPWGQSGDIPVPGDYDGDGKLDIAVFRPSTGMWHMLQSSNGYYSELFGADGDKPVGIKATYASRGAGNHTFTRAPAWAVPARRAPVRGVKQDTSANQAD